MALCWLAAVLMLRPSAVAQQSMEQVAAYYYDNGEFEQAAQYYEELYRKGANKYYYQRLYSTYLELGKYKEAMKLVERRYKSFPKDLYLMVDGGNVYLRQQQKKKAEKQFDKAIESITNNLQPVPDLARAFVNIGRYDYAVRTYLTARERTKNRQLYFSELVGVYQRMGDYEAMTREYFDLLDAQPGMMNSIQISMQRALREAPDEQLSQGVRQALVERVQEHPENKNYLEMMLWYSLQQNDFQFAMTQAKAVDARFPDQEGEPVYRVAKIAQSNEDYATAGECYHYLSQKGREGRYYLESRVGELEVQFAQINNHYSIDKKQIELLSSRYLSAIEELGKNEITVPLMRHYASLRAYYADDAQGAVSMLDDVLELQRLKPAVRDEVKLELGDVLLFAGEVWDASLLYMQVEKSNKNDVLGAQAKFKNAKLSYFTHEFEWAKSQLNVLRASTSKLIANDAMELSLLISDNMEDDSTYGTLEVFADADLLMYRNMLDAAWEEFDKVARSVLSHPLLDEVLLRKAQIRLKQARYAEADSLLHRIVEFYPNDITADDALFMMAELNEQQLGNLEKAREYYERLIVDYPTSLYVDQSRKRYNALKSK